MRKYLASLITLILLSACNSGTSNINSGFIITSITPANGSTIPITQAFVAIFSNNLNLATVGNVALKTESGTNVVIDCAGASSNSIICTPVSSLSYTTGYILTYGTGIQNAAGNSLTQTVYNYTTFTNQGVASVAPASGSINPNATTFNFQFSESMQLATLNTSQTPDNVLFSQNVSNVTGSKDLKAGVNIPITCTSTNPTVTNCSLSESQLTPGESYTLTLTDKIVSSNGVPITPQSLNYVTDNYVTPTVTVSPVSGWYGASQLIPGKQFTVLVYFSVPMNMLTMNATNITLYNAYTGAYQSGSCAASNNTQARCTFNIVSFTIPYCTSIPFYLVVSSNVISAADVPLSTTTIQYGIPGAC